MNIVLKWIFAFVVCIIAGIGIGVSVFHFAPTVKQALYSSPRVYDAVNQEALLSLKDTQPYALAWASLIPEYEKQIIQKYQRPQATTPTQFSDQILLSLEASTDQAYISAMQSANTVEYVEGKYVSISGFIVPIDFADDKNLNDIFIVPYFGACLHFPPPPPNQMMFARLSGPFKNFDITQAYTLKGVVTREMFDDKLGTSAYTLHVASITPYFGEPDDFRQH